MNRYNINYTPRDAADNKKHLQAPLKSFDVFLQEAIQPVSKRLPGKISSEPYRHFHSNVGLLCTIKRKTD